MAAGGVGGRRGAAAADFLSAAWGGVGGRSYVCVARLRDLDGSLDTEASGATVIFLIVIGVGRVLFPTTDCSGEDFGIRRCARASLLPGLSTSNMEISEFVGGIGCESTASTSCVILTL